MFKSPAAHCCRGLYFNLHPVLKIEPHIFLAVDRHKIHHGVPGSLVKIIHLLRQAPQLIHEVLHHFPLCLFLRDGCLHLLQPCFRRFKPLHQSVITFCIFALVLRDAGVFPNAFLYQFRRHVHLPVKLPRLCLQLPGFKCCVPDSLKACKDAGFLPVDRIQCLYEKLPDGFLVQMRRGAFFPAVKFVVALPDHLPVFIVRMPYLGAVPAPAVPTPDFAGEDAHAAIPAVPFSP